MQFLLEEINTKQTNLCEITFLTIITFKDNKQINFVEVELATMHHHSDLCLRTDRSKQQEYYTLCSKILWDRSSARSTD